VKRICGQAVYMCPLRTTKERTAGEIPRRKKCEDYLGDLANCLHDAGGKEQSMLFFL
jgi:hypothetical protein